MGSGQLIVFRVADGSPLLTLDLILGGHGDQEWAGGGRGRRLGTQLDPDDVDHGNDVRFFFSARSDVVCSTEAVRAVQCDPTRSPQVQLEEGVKGGEDRSRLLFWVLMPLQESSHFLQVVPTP